MGQQTPALKKCDWSGWAITGIAMLIIILAGFIPHTIVSAVVQVLVVLGAIVFYAKQEDWMNCRKPIVVEQ